MAAPLREMLLTPDVQPQVVADCEALVNGEVSGMSGVSGTAVKLAYRAVRTYDAGHIHYMIETLLPNIADALEPTGRTTAPTAGQGSVTTWPNARTRCARRCSRSPTSAGGTRTGPSS